MKKYQELWNNIIEELSNNYERDVIEDIFGESKKVVKYSNGLLYILVPSLYVQNKINKIYLTSIKKLSEKLIGENLRFKFVTNEEFLKEEKKYEIAEKPKLEYETNLKNSYTFDSFIIGDTNRFATRSAIMVVEHLGEYANPLYIFGGVGLGKTHLMQAIGNELLDKDINKKVLYIQAQKYIEEYGKAVQNHTIEQFEEKYTNLDLLLVDDIQMLSMGTKTQQEFFKLFCDMYDNKKQIVITSDCPPNKLEKIMDRLTTRFAYGLLVDIQAPDLPLRVKILKRKLYEESSSTIIEDSILEYIASLYRNIRDLEGGLRRVLSYSVIFNKDITIDLVKDCLASIIETKQENGSDYTYENLKSIVANFYSITIEDLISKKRTSNLVTPRHICMYLLKTKYNLPYKKIGNLMGGKDHSTVMSGCAKIEQDIKINKDLKLAIETLNAKIG